MLTRWFLIVILSLLPSPDIFAAGLQVADQTITTAIAEQSPVDRIGTYPADFGKLYCYTRILGAKAETEITHVWYYGVEEMARITLPVRSSDWRTYSSKRFLPQWIGPWKVVVLDAGQKEIATIPFRLE